MREEHECDCCDAQAPPEVLAKNCFLARDAYDHLFTMFLCASCRAGWKWEWHEAPNPQEIYAAFHPSPNDSTDQDDQGIPFDETAWKASLRQSTCDAGVEMDDTEFDAFTQLALEHW